jgi:hypothetical protein
LFCGFSGGGFGSSNGSSFSGGGFGSGNSSGFGGSDFSGSKYGDHWHN